MTSASTSCKYCGASNTPGANRCLACGAPIDLPVVPPVTVTTVKSAPSVATPSSTKDTTPEQIRDALEAAPISPSLKEGLLAAGAGIGALGVGSFFARTTAEAGSIAISTFLVGYFSALNRSGIILAIFGGVIIGLMVGLVVKRPWAVLLSAPIGTIAGLAAAYFLSASVPGVPLTPLLGAAGGGLLALIGGRRGNLSGVAKWYARLRPLLGMTSGFLFVLIGFGIGRLAH